MPKKRPEVPTIIKDIDNFSLPEGVHNDFLTEVFDFELYQRRLSSIIKNSYRIIFFFALLAVILFALALITDTTIYFPFSGLSLVLSGIASFVYYINYLDFKVRTKELFFSPFIKFFFPELQYESNLGIESHKIRYNKTYDDISPNILKTEDYIKGQSTTLQFECCELKLFKDSIFSIGGIPLFSRNEKFILLVINNPPLLLNKSFLEKNIAITDKFRQLNTFWNTTVSFHFGLEKNLIISIPLESPYLELKPGQKIYTKGIFDNYYLQVKLIVDLVEAIETEITAIKKKQ